MKSDKLGLVFAMIFICFAVIRYQETMEVMAIQKLQSDYNRAIDQAVEDALSGLAEKDNGREVYLNKQEVVDKFLMSLSINMNKMENRIG